MILAACLLVVFSIIASTDGFYFHIYRYRLHTRPASYREHLLHTVNVCLFVPQVLLMFCVRPTGAWLWVTVVLAVVVLGVEIFDVFAEDESRRDLGGLTPPEYVMHFLMSGLRMGFLCAFYVARPPSDFLATTGLGPVYPMQLLAGVLVAVPGFFAAAAHVALAVIGRREREGAERTAYQPIRAASGR